MVTENNPHLLFEIVPGRSIGPFQLGMSRAQIAELARQTGVRTDTGPFHGGMSISFDKDDRAVSIDVPANFGSIGLALAGEELKSFYNDEVRSQLAKITTLPTDWTEPIEAGLAIFHWEMADPDVFSFRVFLPGYRFDPVVREHHAHFLKQPSAELAATIRNRIDEGRTWAKNDPMALQDVSRNRCLDAYALLLVDNGIEFWAITEHAEVLVGDHDRTRIETELNTFRLYAVVEQGSRTYPELKELLPQKPEGLEKCPNCLGTGVREVGGAAQRCDCYGLGWLV